MFISAKKTTRCSTRLVHLPLQIDFFAVSNFVSTAGGQHGVESLLTTAERLLSKCPWEEATSAAYLQHGVIGQRTTTRTPVSAAWSHDTTAADFTTAVVRLSSTAAFRTWVRFANNLTIAARVRSRIVGVTVATLSEYAGYCLLKVSIAAADMITRVVQTVEAAS